MITREAGGLVAAEEQLRPAPPPFGASGSRSRRPDEPRAGNRKCRRRHLAAAGSDQIEPTDPACLNPLRPRERNEEGCAKIRRGAEWAGRAI
jgi:hypothetical protein